MPDPAPGSAVDFNGQDVTNVGEVDGYRISEIALDNMPAIPIGGIDFNGQDLESIGLVGGFDISTMALDNLPNPHPSGDVDFNGQNIVEVQDIEMDGGLQISNGASINYVLTCQDALGNSAWQAAPGGGGAKGTRGRNPRSFKPSRGVRSTLQ